VGEGERAKEKKTEQGEQYERGEKYERGVSRAMRLYISCVVFIYSSTV
jgi:hypothetical protein